MICIIVVSKYFWIKLILSRGGRADRPRFSRQPNRAGAGGGGGRAARATGTAAARGRCGLLLVARMVRAGVIVLWWCGLWHWLSWLSLVGIMSFITKRKVLLYFT